MTEKSGFDSAMVDAAIHWMDTMKERLDHYEVHRNEFLSDMRQPPRNVKFLREVLLPFCENTLLMDNIAKSEGLCYWKGGKENRLRIIVSVEHEGKLEEVVTTYPTELVDVDGKNDINYPNNFPYLLQHKSYKPGHGGTKEENTLTEALNGRTPSQKDFEICLPNEHVIYSILENLIRNSAKHNAGKFKPLNDVSAIGLNTLNIHVDITDAGADYYHCTIYDNVSQVGLDKLTALLNRKKQPLLQDGRPNRDNMGMADMKINAFLLKSGKDFTENDLNEALDIVICDRCSDGRHEHAVVRLDEEGTVKKYAWKRGVEVEDGTPNGKGSFLFGYRFKLTKAKKVAWIGKAAEEKAKDDDYKRAGIYGYTTWTDYIKSHSDGLAAYEIAMLENEVWEELNKDNGKDLRGHLASLPFRVLVNGESKAVAPHDRRVMFKNSLLFDCTPQPSDFLGHVLREWMKGKYRLGRGMKMMVRGKASPVGDIEDPLTLTESELFDFEVCFNGRKVKPTIDPNGARLWTIDHHGELTDAYSFNGDHDTFKANNSTEPCYSYSGKGNRDHDRLMEVLKGAKNDMDALCLAADRMHRRVVVVDERIAELVAGKPGPVSKASLKPDNLWTYYAAMNIYVVTRLCINEEWSYQLATGGLSELELKVKNEAQFTWTPGSGSKNGSAIACTLKSLLVQSDILVIHRTHWLKLGAMTEVVRMCFSDIFVTSGAGQPVSLYEEKFLPLSILTNFLGSNGPSKFGLAHALDGAVLHRKP